MLDRLPPGRTVLRCLAVAGVALTLTACSLAKELRQASADDSRETQASPESTTDRAMAAMAVGNVDAARQHAARVLRRDPTNALALLTYGMAAEKRGNTPRARLAYQRILDLSPQKTAGVRTVLGARGGGGDALPVRTVARRRLEHLATEQDEDDGKAETAKTARTMPGVSGNDGRAPDASGRPDLLPFDPDVAARFRVLERLRRQGMITRDEYRRRRRANLGALLRYSHDPPAPGLDRPVPSAGQIMNRLKFLRDAVEKGSISPEQQAAERQAILDALLPADPEQRAAPPPSPGNMLDTAALYGRLEALHEKGLVTRDEMEQERRTVDAMTAPEPRQEQQKASGTGDKNKAESDGGSDKQQATGAPTGLTGSGGQGMGVHIASYRSAEQARRGWKQLQEKFPDILKGRDYRLKEVNLGGGKGVFHRLVVGPFQDRNAAKQVCDKLKARNQFCKPTLYPAGG